MMQLWVIRHGESTGNVRQVMQGTLDTKLTTLGEQQAYRLGMAMAARNWRPTQIYASPLQRTRHTAELIAAQFPKPPSLSTHPELLEIAVGELKGLSLPEIRQRFPEFERKNPQGWLRFAPWGGEDATAVWQRVHQWMDALSADWDLKHHPPLAFVTHGIVARALIAWALDNRRGFQMQYTLGNCTLVSLTMRQRKDGSVRRHLAGLWPVETWEP